MIYTVTFNPSLDYILDLTEFERNQVNRTTGEKILPGGKGINVSIVLQNLGIDNRAICFTSGFTGEALKALLMQRDMNADFIDIANGLTRINVKMRCGDETEVTDRDRRSRARISQSSMRSLDIWIRMIIWYLQAACQTVCPRQRIWISCRCCNIITTRLSWMRPENCSRMFFLYHPFLIKPNRTELGNLFGVEVTTMDQAEVYAKQLQERGARNVLVSMSYQGAVLVTEDGRVIRAAAPKGQVKNSVGAGDSMLAGFLAGYIERDDYEYALKLGICAGSASAFSEELATKEEIDTLFQTQMA